MSGRDAVRMTEAELAEFFHANLKVQVGTIGPDGAPHLTTLFYVMWNGKIAFWTYGRSQKIRNLQRDARISLLVEDGTDYFELRGATIHGKATIIDDPEELLAIGTAVAVRMIGAESAEQLGDIGMDAVNKQARKRVAVVVEPDKVATWDHRKMLAQFAAATPADGQEQGQ